MSQNLIGKGRVVLIVTWRRAFSGASCHISPLFWPAVSFGLSSYALVAGWRAGARGFDFEAEPCVQGSPSLAVHPRPRGISRERDSPPRGS
eukprot:7389158-Prymnesium_polylepis.3